ncbi:hypothetical protein OE88DRAFT_1035597 [Heliocybe sulcata]|uniref:Uncharacterized protein n=1 Tax=Heliocybe sulcata TaxID=5364 RepID=A0A5C3NDC8_9AGAM|nr:hypothetical protein OE88DRAFT_1035597 [Heliocybe sulcata]
MSVAVDTSASSSGKRKQLKKKAPRKARLPSTEDTFFVDAPDQDDPIQNDDPPERPIDDDVEFIEQPPAQAAPPLPPRHPARSTASKTSKPLANEASLVDPLERCYRDLRDIRLKIALKEGIESQDDVLSDECLQMLCCTSIRDLGDFRRVLSDAYTAEIAEEKHQRYEQHFLDICIRKSLELEEPSKARGGAIANTKSFDATEMQTRYAYSKPFSRRKAF